MTTALATPRKVPRRPALGPAASLAVPLVVCVLTFLWQLGRSSLFVDETSSWRVAAGSIGGVFRVDRATEVAPPTYYLLLHLWIRALGADSVWAMRFLSVLAGIALVAAVWWLARLTAGTGAAFVAALLAALSPLVVQYAQEVRSYVFVMLLATIAVAAAIQATRTPGGGNRWLGLSAGASVATMWLHYTGLLVIVPLAVFVWTAGALGRKARRIYLIVCVAGLVIVSPLMVTQLRAGHQGGVAPYAHPTLTNLLRIVGTPFDGRFAPLAVAYITGTLVVTFAVLVSALSPQTRRMPDRLLVLTAAVTPVLGVVAVNIAARLLDEHTYYSLITRYTAVATPFMLVVVAWTVLAIPRLAGLALSAVIAVAIITGLHATYSSQALEPNLGAAIARISHDYRPGDTVVFTGAASHVFDPDYYVAQLRQARPGAPIVRTPGTVVAVPSSGTRLWVVSDTTTAALLAPRLAHAGWHPLRSTVLTPDIVLVLATR